MGQAASATRSHQLVARAPLGRSLLTLAKPSAHPTGLSSRNPVQRGRQLACRRRLASTAQLRRCAPPGSAAAKRTAAGGSAARRVHVEGSLPSPALPGAACSTPGGVPRRAAAAGARARRPAHAGRCWAAATLAQRRHLARPAGRPHSAHAQHLHCRLLPQLWPPPLLLRSKRVLRRWKQTLLLVAPLAVPLPALAAQFPVRAWEGQQLRAHRSRRAHPSHQARQSNCSARTWASEHSWRTAAPGSWRSGSGRQKAVARRRRRHSGRAAVQASCGGGMGGGGLSSRRSAGATATAAGAAVAAA